MCSIVCIGIIVTIIFSMCITIVSIVMMNIYCILLDSN